MIRAEHWYVRNKGLRADFLPDPQSEIGHDPHILVAAPTDPDIPLATESLWHLSFLPTVAGTGKILARLKVLPGLGLRLPWPMTILTRRGFALPTAIRHVLPLKGRCVFAAPTMEARPGRIWRNGLPQENCYDIVYRHALASSGDAVAFGTTTGNLFFRQTEVKAGKRLITIYR